MLQKENGFLYCSYCCSHHTKDGGQNLTTRNLSYYMKPEIMKNVQRVKELAHFRSAKRRKSIKNFCKNKRYSIPKVERNNAANITNRWRQEMWWDIKSGFAWCCVYKGCSNILIGLCPSGEIGKSAQQFRVL